MATESTDSISQHKSGSSCVTQMGHVNLMLSAIDVNKDTGHNQPTVKS